ncbi:ERCC4 domain-containing protein [Rhodococcus sp. G-MC3]|uniref:ERCC4 domain-containing protein n=1 Tax=Rhodococcus sp. G-MC3 TaxID=3046209 RepID=UPI0024B9E1B6|nr:histone-like nucleoid-structuring protein Lsr2 [Rhodococcus sp. G-MC3]MDJ0396041.1 ERCC4 domain-containing protein [Rhodococcus sp. G-MC3]
MELVIAKNPDTDSSLPYLVRIPIAGVPLLRARDVWPRTSAVYCHPVPDSEWPDNAEIVERIELRVCERRGAAIDIVANRSRENRSQIVFTTARGRDMVFWQSPRTRTQSKPKTAVSRSKASGISDLEIIVDAHERYAYSFTQQRACTTKQALPCGDYAVAYEGKIVASVERKTSADLLSSMTSGRLRYAMADLAALPRAAVVIEDQYSTVLSSKFVTAKDAADGLAELQVRYPSVPIVFAQTRKLAEEWTFRYLAAAMVWVSEDADAMKSAFALPSKKPVRSGPSNSEVRTWARAQGYAVADRGAISREIREKFDAEHEDR